MITDNDYRPLILITADTAACKSGTIALFESADALDCSEEPIEVYYWPSDGLTLQELVANVAVVHNASSVLDLRKDVDLTTDNKVTVDAFLSSCESIKCNWSKLKCMVRS